MKKSYLIFTLLFTILITNLLNAQPANNWWNNSVFYEIFVRSYYDSNNDGIGDFNGIVNKLNYLNDGDSLTKNDLGIKGIWLMPINASPSNHGYDVTNYKAVNAQYGTSIDFKNLVSEAHKKGIKVVIDFVINHTSSQHPWFVQSAANNTFYRNFYRWSDTKPSYKGPWGQDVWYSKNTSNYYALFWSEMPDLNYTYQPVRDSIFDAAKFWINEMNVDGFRLDAAMYLFENGNNLMNQPETFQFWSDFNNYCKTLNPNFMTVGEVWTGTNTVKNYNNKLDNCFEFDLSYAMLNALKTSNTQQLRTEMKYAYDNLQFNKFSSFLTNHDQNRVYDEMNGDQNKLKVLASIYLNLPGTPYLYYGEEIGMKGSKPDEKIRTPMQWNSEANAGFSIVSPWQGININYASFNVQTMNSDANSLLNYYKKLIQLRNNKESLRIGTYQNIICSDSSVFSFMRKLNNQEVLVLVNTSNRNTVNLVTGLQSANYINGNFEATNLLNESLEYLRVNDGTGSGIELKAYETKIIEINKSSSINEMEDGNNFELYPNPGNETLNIKLKNQLNNGNVQLTIYNSIGEEILSKQILSNQLNEINIEGLTKGIYLIQVAKGKCEKFVKW